MSGPLNSIFASCESLINPNLALFGITPSYGHTGIERFQESVWPRICWVPTTEEIMPPRGMGGDSDTNGVLPASSLPPLYTRMSNVECDVWGADRDTAETMISCVVSGVHDALSNGSYGIASARWLLPEEGMKDGEIYRITFQFMVPIVRVAPGTTTATVTSIPETPTSTFHVGP